MGREAEGRMCIQINVVIFLITINECWVLVLIWFSKLGNENIAYQCLHNQQMECLAHQSRLG